MAVWKLQLQQTIFALLPKGEKANQSKRANKQKTPTESWVPKTSPIMVSLPEKQQPRKGLQKHKDRKLPSQQDSKAAEGDGCGGARKPQADKNTQDSARTHRANVCSLPGHD